MNDRGVLQGELLRRVRILPNDNGWSRNCVDVQKREGALQGTRGMPWAEPLGALRAASQMIRLCSGGAGHALR
eukprot:8879193-Alexandrium_andersonii.AAC.1